MKTFSANLIACAVLCIFPEVALCRPSFDHVVHEKRDIIPRHWTRISPASADTQLNIRIALKESNLDRAEEFLLQVSHPKSEKYGQAWTPQQVIDTFAPSQEAVADATSWLLQMDVERERISHSAGRNLIKINSTVGEAERLLSTTYSIYANDEGTTIVACESYSVPAAVRRFIDFVSPTVQFDSRLGTVGKRVAARRKVTRSTAQRVARAENADPLANCQHVVTPDCLRAL